MAVASIATLQNKLANSLVAARKASPFASAFASATNALKQVSSTDASQAASQQSYSQSLSNVQGKLTQWLQAAGVDPTQEIQLSLGVDGTVQLANSPPDAAQIQQMLNSHPELSGMLQSLSNSYKQVNPTDSTSTASLTSQFVLTLSGGNATATMS
jgi:arsenate reductase-like glutaredoxin family protein